MNTQRRRNPHYKVRWVRLLMVVFTVSVAVIILVTLALNTRVSENSRQTVSQTDLFYAPGITELKSRAPEIIAPITDLEVTQTHIPEPVPLYVLVSLGEFSLSAYCPCVLCTGIWSAEHPSRIGTNFIQKTASGTIPIEGRTIAVDPNVIPFGTTIVINDHAFIAEDRGGAVKGNHIDLFFESHRDALMFGRQTAEVFIKNDN